jgi:UDP-N-acetylmuramoyl-tripeptide--D-alanyl-D-alanine ligase
VIRLSQGIVVIDDSYNASPAATRRALDVLRTAETAGRRIAVLGEMLELGDHGMELHEGVGRAAGAARLDVLIAVGGDAAGVLAGAAVVGGLARERVQHAATSGLAADAVAALVRAGDVILVKGSRGVRTDQVVDRLKAEFA